MDTVIELAKHFPLCILACLIVHLVETNVPAFRRFTHLEWLGRKADCHEHHE